MSERPSVQEIAAFLADVRASRTADANPADLLARKADLLERIADAMPGDAEAAELARTARAAADEAAGQ
ncbi:MULTISPECIES: hypothetical protein [Streptomyces]|uniref:Uncharacterized protein n=2 Tax=Streptomyces TaxID=1883 RepID=A0A3M8EY30_9ACTN|nr:MULTISPECIES: hypothetical protein [Streptomyces]KNE83195.1 hypothetical protein ADZ36_06320 [Streptomyces fradiae]OFA54397.1 hypothetical protein BEN35_08700 [Streptomyces fradiae]PQM20856.1 hypothetical protein Sfr7A_24995 [Streptomyces xinghaiensis]RKM95827.1 hypothetical protein SFRA_012330 [Streptomyces xinghaiensis]RNC70807.1 hypothetical protein DC095_024105 [Streptomyces xinghaiensis]